MRLISLFAIIVLSKTCFSQDIASHKFNHNPYQFSYTSREGANLKSTTVNALSGSFRVPEIDLEKLEDISNNYEKIDAGSKPYRFGSGYHCIQY